MKKTVFLFISFFCLTNIFSQNTSKDKIEYFGETEKYVLVERTDLRRYDNGRYTGLTSREVRSFVSPISTPKNVASEYLDDSWFSGNFMVLESTKSGSSLTAKGLDDLIPSTFHSQKYEKLME